MSASIRVQRIENGTAVRYVEDDQEAESAIRGWTGLPPAQKINLPFGVWVYKRRDDNQIYILSNEDFMANFVRAEDGQVSDA